MKHKYLIIGLAVVGTIAGMLLNRTVVPLLLARELLSVSIMGSPETGCGELSVGAIYIRFGSMFAHGERGSGPMSCGEKYTWRDVTIRCVCRKQHDISTETPENR
jgi:hypothetical protein